MQAQGAHNVAFISKYPRVYSIVYVNDNGNKLMATIKTIQKQTHTPVTSIPAPCNKNMNTTTKAKQSKAKRDLGRENERAYITYNITHHVKG